MQQDTGGAFEVCFASPPGFGAQYVSLFVLRMSGVREVLGPGSATAVQLAAVDYDVAAVLDSSAAALAAQQAAWQSSGKDQWH